MGSEMCIRDSADEEDIVLGTEIAELFRRSMTGETLAESIEVLSEKVILVREALEISRETGTTPQKKKVTNLVETTARDAVKLLKQLVLLVHLLAVRHYLISVLLEKSQSHFMVNWDL